MSYEFDDDTACQRASLGLFDAVVSRRWDVGAGPNGGYLAALVLRAMLEESPQPLPLTMTVHYMERPQPAACEIEVELLRSGRGHANLAARLVQEGRRKCAALLTTARARSEASLDFFPPPPFEKKAEKTPLVRRESGGPALWDRLETRAEPSGLFSHPPEAGDAVSGGWTRLADGRPSDPLAIALFLDCWPPAIFNRTLLLDPVGAPTLEYTVHWRGPLHSQYCFTRFETHALRGGYVEEDGRLWDEDGCFVAESRQLARYLPGDESSDEPARSGGEGP